MSSTRSSKIGSNKKETNLLVLDRETHTPSVLVGLLKETLSKFKKIGGNKFDASVRGRATFLEQTFKKSLENGVSPKIINEARTDCIIGFYNSVINRDKTRQKINGRSPREGFLLRTGSAFSEQCRSLKRSDSAKSFLSDISFIFGTEDLSPRFCLNSNKNDVVQTDSGDSGDSSVQEEGYITPPASPRFKRAAFSPDTTDAIYDFGLFLIGRSPRNDRDSLLFIQDTP
jgi:hypothetical protein